jgi:hypothetical protein
MTDDEMRDAFDPNFKLPPIVKPVESVDRVLDKISAAADLIMAPCPHCDAKVTPTSEPGVVGITHEVGCPDYVAD